MPSGLGPLEINTPDSRDAKSTRCQAACCLMLGGAVFFLWDFSRFCQGVFHGRGTRSWSNGDRYTGDFVNGEQEGVGASAAALICGGV